MYHSHESEIICSTSEYFGSQDRIFFDLLMSETKISGSPFLLFITSIFKSKFNNRKYNKQVKILREKLKVKIHS